MYSFIEIALSAGLLIVLISVLSICVCGCKNSNQKSELVGTAGVVKIHYDEEAPSPTPTTPASIKRASTQNSQRSLPEIPHVVGRHDSGDTASEIYATVNIDDVGALKKPVVATASTSREHPYEHAYAKLQNECNITGDREVDNPVEDDIQIEEMETEQPGPESVVISASVAISGQLPSSQELPYITPPSPRPHTDNVHFSGDSTDSTKGYTSISVREPLSNIRAQSAKTPVQPHYATVSDDSDEMYAAIEEASVGEGSDTYAQIAPEPRRRHTVVDPPIPATDHSTRRSAPPEFGGTTSNANHSRQASTSSCSMSAGALGSPKPEKRQANSPLPPPPPAPPAAVPTRSSVDAALAQRHQRISSTGDLHGQNDKLRRSFNEKHQRNNSCVSSSDFYGCNYPVEKHRFSSSDLVRPLVAKELNFDIDQREDTTDNLYNSIDGPNCTNFKSTETTVLVNSDQRVTESPSRNVDDMYAKVMKKTRDKLLDDMKMKEIVNQHSEGNVLKYRNDDPGYETIDRKKIINHGYETIARKERTNSQSQDPTYETVKEVGRSRLADNVLGNLNHISSHSGPSSMVNSDPGYEHIFKTDANASDSDPNYEVLNNPPTPPYASITPNYHTQPMYSTVNKRLSKYNNWQENNNDDATIEPNYESMPHEPVYTTGSESDPNYESVRPKDSNYDSVSNQDPNYESLRPKDPKYESVRSKESRKDPNYESVKYFEVSQSTTEEKGNVSSAGIERSDSSAGYEKINAPVNRDSKATINGGAGTIGDYFQV